MHRAIPSRLSALARGAVAALAATAIPAFASTSGVVISQVYGGGGNSGAVYANDYVELLNTSASAVAIDGWSIQYTSASGTGNFSTNVAKLSGTIPAGHFFLVQLAAGANTSLPALPKPDAIGTLNLSGTGGKVLLSNQSAGIACNGGSTVCSTPQLASVVDLVGWGGANFAEGNAAAVATTNSTALLRAAGGCTDTDNNAADFTAGAPVPRNTAAAATTCTSSGGGGGGGTPTGTPLAIYQIQGSGATSPYVGQVVATHGAVTKVNNNGFFLQDVVGDNNPATSDGVFVFTNGAPTVTAGQTITLTATVSEFNVGAATNADTAAHTLTELTGPTNIVVTGTNVFLTPVAIQMPLASADELEKYEGMLVTLNGPFTVQQNYFLGRFGELTLATGGRLQTPTNVARPGAAANALNADNVRRTILLDDGTSVQDPNPTPYMYTVGADHSNRAGDVVTSITGVLDYGLTSATNTDPGAYKINPTQPVTFKVANPRTTAADATPGNLRVASGNVENFFTTLNDGTNKCPPSNTADDCRGANSAFEFNRQQTKVVDELLGLNADVIGLMELQNNGTVAEQNLVDALNAKSGAGTWALVPDAATGPGTDAIKVGIIYKPAKVTPVGAALSDAVALNNRAPIAQTFKLANGEKFNLVVNHLKSKGCSGSTGADLDQGDLQGCWNDRRVQQARELMSFVTRVQSAGGTTDTLLVGDFNAYAQEDPIATLTGSGWVDQIGRYNSFGYSYVFNGTSGRLDHALASGTLSAKVTGANEWHINADEPEIVDYNAEFKQPACPTCSPDYTSLSPYRASDHDPLVVGLNLVHAINGTSGRDTIVGTPGDDVITGGAGADRITGNGGRDVFVYTSMNDAADTITDFAPGDDRLDLTQLLAGIGASPATAFANGVVQLAASGANTVVMIDTDGAAGPNVARPLVTLLNVTPAQIDVARDFGLGAATASAKVAAKLK